MIDAAHDLVSLANAWTTASTWWVFSGASLLAAGCLVARAARFARRFANGVDGARSGLAIGLGLFSLALILRLLLPDPTHYTFNDEYEYVGFARLLAETGRYALSTSPPAVVFLYAAAFRLIGFSSDVAFDVTLVAASLTAPALYWMIRVLSGDRALAAVAGVLLAVAPLHIKHSASASLEIVALLFVLLAVGTFVELLRRPGWLETLCFALSFFAVLTSRAEGWFLPILLALLVLLIGESSGRGSRAQIAVVGLAVLCAAAYLPGILSAPIRYDAWWRSQLPPLALLETNLAFWIGGEDAPQRLPLLIALVGLVAGLRTHPRLILLGLACFLLYSIIFALYGINVGYVEEAHQPPPWGARAAGHDMFRFNVLLLPGVVLVLASGLLALARGGLALVGGNGTFAVLSPPTRIALLASIGALLTVSVASFGALNGYHPLSFIASHYNREFQIAEFRFLHDFFRTRPRGATLYVLPQAEAVVLAEVSVRPLRALASRRATSRLADRFVYVNDQQLTSAEHRRAFRALRHRFRLAEIVRRGNGDDRFHLYAVEAAPPASPDLRAIVVDLSRPALHR